MASEKGSPFPAPSICWCRDCTCEQTGARSRSVNRFDVGRRPNCPYSRVAVCRLHGSGSLRSNSDRHHSRFSAVFVARLPGRSKDGSDIVQIARGRRDNHPKHSCRSSQQMECFSPLSSQCNRAGICSFAAKIPTRPWHKPFRISRGPCSWHRTTVASEGHNEVAGCAAITALSQVRTTAAMP